MKRVSLILMVLLLMLPLLAKAEPTVFPFIDEDTGTYRGACTLENGNLILAADVTKDMQGVDHGKDNCFGKLMCVNEKGEILWERRDGEEGIKTLYTTPVALSDRTILAGKITYTGGYETKQWTNCVFSEQGELIAQYPAELKVQDAIAAPMGYIVGTLDEQRKKSYSYLSLEGKTLWTYDKLDTMVLATVGQKDGLVLIGSTRDSQQPIAVKIAEDGTVQWTQVFQLAVRGRLSSGVSTKDGKLLLGGGLVAEDEQAQALILCLGADGTLLWKSTFADIEKLYSIDGIQATADGYLLMSEYRSNSRLWLGKMDENGSLMEHWTEQTPDVVYGGSQLYKVGSTPVVCSYAEFTNRDNLPSYASQMLLTLIDLDR